MRLLLEWNVTSVGGPFFPCLAAGERALVRSQSGSGAGVCTVHCFGHFRSADSGSHSPSVVLPGVAVPLTLLDTTVQVLVQGCWQDGGFPLGCEAGTRVTTNVMVRDSDLEAMKVQDGRRLEVVADGLPLHGGAQLAIDTTIVSALHCDGRCCKRGRGSFGRSEKTEGENLSRVHRSTQSLSTGCSGQRGVPEASCSRQGEE